MKAEELRLNNLVLVNRGADLVSIVTWIQQDSLTLEFDRQADLINGIIAHPSECKPIPLTEEWLLKFGFEWKGDNALFYRPESIGIDDSFISVMIEDGDMFIHLIQPDPINGLNHIIELPATKNHVHDLQNIYHALTGQELTIKENASAI